MYYEFSFSAYREAIAVALGRNCYIETREDVEYDHYDSMGKYFEWILDQIQICADKIKAGTYQEEIDANVPYTMRSGTIYRKDLWMVSPDSKEYDQDDLSEEEIKTFCKCMKDNHKEYAEGMTSGKFFDACLIGYKVNGLDCDGLTSREAYLRWSDRRDDGLSKINEDSADELIRWKKGELQEFNGHHPWEIFRGGNSTHVDFGIDFEISHPERTEFFIAGYHRQKEVVRMYLALKNAGIHVYVWGAEELCERLTGQGKVGIVPNGVTPRYCQSWFPNESIESFINIHTYEDDYEEIVKRTDWDPVTYSRLK